MFNGSKGKGKNSISFISERVVNGQSTFTNVKIGLFGQN